MQVCKDCRRVGVGNQLNVVGHGIAHDGVASDLDGRVRIDIDNCIDCRGITAFLGRNEHRCIGVGRGITVNNNRRVNKSIKGGACNLLTVSVPEVRTIGVICHTQCDFAARANGSIAHILELDSRSSHDLHRIHTFGFTSRIGLENIKFVFHPTIFSLIACRMDSSDKSCSTVDGFITVVGRVVSVPTIDESVIVIVDKVGRKNHFAARADGIDCMGDFDMDGIVHIDAVLFAGDRATSFIVHNSNREDVRLIARIGFVHQRVVCICTRTDGLVEESPFIAVCHVFNRVIEIGLQHNHAVLADDLVAGNLDSCVREHEEGVRLHFGDTTAVLL